MTAIGLPKQHPLHAQVQAYREERERQERELEAQTGGYAGDTADYFARGGKPLITFKDWLKSNKISDAEQAARSGPVTHDVYTPAAGSGWDDETPEWAKMAKRLRILFTR